jgi:hypothetical protein
MLGFAVPKKASWSWQLAEFDESYPDQLGGAFTLAEGFKVLIKSSWSNMSCWICT